MEISPMDLYFRKRAVRRFIFNNNIVLTELDPKSIVNLGVMHNTKVLKGKVSCNSLLDGELFIENNESSFYQASYNVGYVNPFAAYDVNISEITGQGKIALDFSDLKLDKRLIAEWDSKTGNITMELWLDGKFIKGEKVGADFFVKPPFKLRAHLMGVGLSIYCEKGGITSFVGFFDFGELIDLRIKKVCREYKFNVLISLGAGASVKINKAISYLTCGMGQADIRPITDKEGNPLLENNRLWLLMSSRGYGLPHPYQGCYSLDPSTFDLKLEGVIVYDRGDGMLRNEVASHVFYDRENDEWCGWTCGFSDAYPEGKAASGIWSVCSKHDPRRGFSVMNAVPMERDSHSEDPCGVFDAEIGKWRLLLSRFTNSKVGIRVIMAEADHWNGPYKDIAGPVEFNSTGTQIQTIELKKYVFAAGSDEKIRIYSYPNLEYLGDLKMDLPPWAECSVASSWAKGRVWPNIIPLPDGFATRYIALMMDRENFPGITDQNWTYGALHLYDADELEP